MKLDLFKNSFGEINGITLHGFNSLCEDSISFDTQGEHRPKIKGLGACCWINVPEKNGVISDHTRYHFISENRNIYYYQWPTDGNERKGLVMGGVYLLEGYALGSGILNTYNRTWISKCTFKRVYA